MHSNKDRLIEELRLVRDLVRKEQQLEEREELTKHNEVIVKKVNKGIPTVLEYLGRRYILDMGFKGKKL